MLVLRDARHVQILVAGCTFAALCFVWLISQSRSISPLHYASYSGLGTGFQDFEEKPHIELERIKMGNAFEIDHDDTASVESLEKLNQALLDRFASMDVNTDHPDCSLNLTRYESSGILANPSGRYESSQRISVALNLYNSQEILPSLSLALLGLVHYLQPTHQIYISIYENDSSDKTPALLGELAAALVAAKISGLTFRSSVLHRAHETERIIALSDIRNEAIFPLLDHAADGILLFVNDVVTCPFDLIELVHQFRLQKAHAVMSTDWDNGDSAGKIRFRDVWVARGINGEMPYQMSQPAGWNQVSPTGSWVDDLWLTQEDAIHQRWLDGLPIPMYSGWNGAVAWDAKLFTQYHLRFRASGKAHWTGGDGSGGLGLWGELMATEGYLDSDCSASECKLIARDVWNLIGNGTRMVLAPQSRTTYTMHEWHLMEWYCPPTRRDSGEDWEKELIDWSNVTIPSEVVCVPSLGEDGSPIDPFNSENTRLRINPHMEGWPRDP